MHLRSRNAVLRQTQHVAMPAVHRKRGASGTPKNIKMEVKTEAMESLNPKAEENSGFNEEQLGVVPAMKLEVVETGSFVKDEEPTVGIKTDDEANSLKMAKKSKHAHAPVNWKAMWDGIAGMRAEKSAAVDAQGCETFNDMTLDPPVRRFHVLVACMLSSQTKDPVTAAAMGRLRAHGLTVESMLAIKQADLAAMLRPVGFFNNKAKYIQQTCATLQSLYQSDIPSTYEGLVALPGVGPKMATLTMSCAWNNTVGICVDIHVHRIANRLGWAKTWAKGGKSQDPEKTRKELEDWLPREHWHDINVLLVGFGQQLCTPLRPKCDSCAINHLCPSAFKKASP